MRLLERPNRNRDRGGAFVAAAPCAGRSRRRGRDRVVTVQGGCSGGDQGSPFSVPMPTAPAAAAAVLRRAAATLAAAVLLFSPAAIELADPRGWAHVQIQPAPAAAAMVTAGSSAAAPSERVLREIASSGGGGEPASWELIGQGASGKAYHVRGEGDDDWVVKVGEGAAAGQGLRRECALLQRIDSRGVERCLGVGSVDGGGRTVEVLVPYLVDDRQLDRVDAALAGDYMRLLIGDVGIRGGVGVLDVQMLYGRRAAGPSAGGAPSQLLLIDLTEGRVLTEDEMGAEARAFVAEVCSFIAADDGGEAQAEAAQALLEVLREARLQGVPVPPALAQALVEAPLPLAPAALREAIAEAASASGKGVVGSS